MVIPGKGNDMPQYRPEPDRFFEKIDKQQDGCWFWTAAISQGTGYGKFQRGRTRKHIGAHRWSYEYHKGLIPAGMVIDHICHVHACVNPDHLRLATSGQNAQNMLLSSANVTGPPGRLLLQADTALRRTDRHQWPQALPRQVLHRRAGRRGSTKGQARGVHPQHSRPHLGSATEARDDHRHHRRATHARRTTHPRSATSTRPRRPSAGAGLPLMQRRDERMARMGRLGQMHHVRVKAARQRRHLADGTGTLNDHDRQWQCAWCLKWWPIIPLARQCEERHEQETA